MILTLAILLSSATLLASAETTFTDAVEKYGEGKVFFSEADFKNDVSCFKPNTTNASKYSITFNSEKDWLEISTVAGYSAVTDITAIPADLDNYTICADLYMIGKNYTGDNALFGMGVNSASAWSKSTYFQQNVQTSGGNCYINNYNSAGKSTNGKTFTSSTPYTLGTKLSLKIAISTTDVSFYLNGTLLHTIAKENLGYAYGNGSPFFIQRENTTIAIDNLMAYAGTGDPDLSNTATVVGHGLAANDTIDMRFIVKYTDSPAYLDVAVTVAGNEVTPKVEKFEGTNASTGEVYGAGSYVYTYTVSLSAKQMTDAVVLTVKDGDKTLASDAYTVNEYCVHWMNSAQEDGASEAVKNVGNVCATMLMYGYMTQVHFGYNTENTPDFAAAKAYIDSVAK